MAISSGSVTPSSTSEPLCSVPPGVYNLSISNVSGVTVYVTAGVTATATNGFAIPTGAPPIVIDGYPGSRGVQLNVVAPTGTVTGVVSWLISTPQ